MLPISSAVQADHEDEMHGTLQGKQSLQGSFITEPWTQMRSGHVKHLQTGLICVVSSAVMVRVAELHVQDGPIPCYTSACSTEATFKDRLQQQDPSYRYTTQFHIL
ncbi:HIRA interacting protein 3, isoform CRA_c [Rattus norvegicus]|uniref:HIRA interacting protein 3, isoform CRA_c n=1 Tax=Rattus norvegicus TaxID=10116 RepID=A6I9H6_RAT|nr:HIRA interacting protein 3, isoform CRA_c [Rattus norvegicus]